MDSSNSTITTSDHPVFLALTRLASTPWRNTLPRSCQTVPTALPVYADGRAHVEYWTRHEHGIARDTFRSVTVGGDHLRILNASEPFRQRRLDRQATLVGSVGECNPRCIADCSRWRWRDGLPRIARACLSGSRRSAPLRQRPCGGHESQQTGLCWSGRYRCTEKSRSSPSHARDRPWTVILRDAGAYSGRRAS